MAAPGYGPSRHPPAWSIHPGQSRCHRGVEPPSPTSTLNRTLVSEACPDGDAAPSAGIRTFIPAVVDLLVVTKIGCERCHLASLYGSDDAAMVKDEVGVERFDLASTVTLNLTP